METVIDKFMPTQDEIIIYEAFDRHIRELHPAQFEVCKDSQCQAARLIEESAQYYQELEVEATE